MSPLNHKLLRDLWRMKGQAIAIGLVIAMGVMLQVMMSGLVTTLDGTRAAYYDRYRMAEIFAPVTRAPGHLVDTLAAIPGVAQAEGRIIGAALVDLEDKPAPVQAQAVSLPERGDPRLNAIYLAAGRMPDPLKPSEILLLDGFAKAHDLEPGDTLRATLNGTRRALNIVGLAQSPEFLYTAAPGELVPDDSRFGVIWMGHSGMTALFDMDGAFNEAVLRMSRDANENRIIDAVDRILAPYGGRGAYPLADQFSHNFVEQEISGLRDASSTVPPLFLAVAAFLLNIVVSRIVQSEREEIGLLKAFGYTNFEVGAHYFNLILVIALGGALAGCLLGIGMGRLMVGIYLQFFKFPFLVFRLDPASFAIGVSVSVLAASAGGIFVLRKVFELTPAVAMRPPAPADYSRTGRVGRQIASWLDQPSRMVLRRITRQPIRMAGAMIGVACGMGLSAAMLSTYAAFDETLDLTFNVVDRSDLSVSFAGPVSESAIFSLMSHDGIIRAEPVRHVPAVLRNGRHEYQGALTGLSTEARMNRAIDANHDPIVMRSDGVILSSTLARILRIEPGDTLAVDVRDGRQPVLELPVVQVAESFLGAPAYLELDALNRALREPGRITGAYLRIDEAQQDDVTEWLKNLPGVAGVSLKSEALAAFERLMDEGAGSTRYVMGTLAFIITFGIVYNAARIAYAERARDLASLRVIGFTRGEVAFVLLGEVAVVTLAAIPVGAAIAIGLSRLIATAYSNDIYSLPVTIAPSAFGNAALVVVGAAIFSGLIVKRDLDRSELVTALKTRE
ncbi:ABC transporter permease [Alexandriicola marinus]|uniref:ABC transporter permease n=1 Tax=Alexandriicola marinus TaxID=2081710 RepID=UPI001F0B9CD2|nr:FtsX-like permease family protein [Alexandriicola marinus]